MTPPCYILPLKPLKTTTRAHSELLNGFTNTCRGRKGEN